MKVVLSLSAVGVLLAFAAFFSGRLENVRRQKLEVKPGVQQHQSQPATSQVRWFAFGKS